jgi:hypothetical protein
MAELPLTRPCRAWPLVQMALVFSALGVTTRAHAQSPEMSPSGREVERATRATILRARQAVWQSWFANDQASLERLLPPGVIAINYGDSTWYDRPGVLQSARDFTRSGAKLVRLEFPRTEIQLFGNVAVLYSLFEVEVEADGQHTVDRGRASEVFVSTPAGWVNASWHLDSGR